MINLNEKIVNEQDKASFTPIVDGDYEVEVVEIKGPEQVSLQNVSVKARDVEGRIIKGQKTVLPQLDFVRFNVTLKIVGGEFDGRRIWTKLTTHPDYVWLLKGFVFATGQTDISLSSLPTLVGSRVKVNTTTSAQTYTKVEVDPETALETEVTKTTEKTFVNRYNKLA